MVFVARVRARATVRPVQEASERLLNAGQPIPQRLVGKNKGLEGILCERGLYPASGLKASCAKCDHAASNDCCCAWLLSIQHDFASECSALQHVVEERVKLDDAGLLQAARHVCLVLPKLHCELNWVERFWGRSKAYTRKHCL